MKHRFLRMGAGMVPTDWAIALMIAIVTFQGVRLFWAVVTPLGSYGIWGPVAPSIIPERDRGALFARVDPFATGPVAEEAQPPLAITLYGVTSAGPLGSAIVSGPDGVQTSVSIGDEIAPGVRLLAVALDRIVVEQGGQKRTVTLPVEAAIDSADSASDPASSTASAPGDKGEDGALALTADRIRNEISFTPRLQNGRVTGINPSPTGDGRLFLAAGFRPGDVIRAVNGQPIASAEDAARIANQLAPGQRLTLEVERGATIASVALLVAQP